MALHVSSSLDKAHCKNYICRQYILTDRCYRYANLQFFNGHSHQYGLSSFGHISIYYTEKKNTRNTKPLAVNKSNENGFAVCFSDFMAYLSEQMVTYDALVVSNGTRSLHCHYGCSLQYQRFHINLVMLTLDLLNRATLEIETDCLQPMEYHSACCDIRIGFVLSQLKRNISKIQDGELNIWCANGTEDVNRCLDIYQHQLEVQSEANGRINGRRNARTFSHFVWLVESIGRVFWMENHFVSSDSKKIRSVYSEPKNIHSVLSESKDMRVVHHGSGSIQLRTDVGGVKNFRGNWRLCLCKFVYRHDPYNIEQDGDVDRTINEVEVGEWKVSVDDTLNSFIQWLRIISTLYVLMISVRNHVHFKLFVGNFLCYSESVKANGVVMNEELKLRKRD